MKEIKIEELRIGNLIFSLDSKTIKEELSIDSNFRDLENIIEVQEYTFIKVKQNPNLYKPIPLTEEWLKRFGFTIVVAPSAYGFDCNKVFQGGVFRGAFSKVKGMEGYHYYGFTINGIYKKIDYVHQLQNLYVALTGEELTIKQ